MVLVLMVELLKLMLKSFYLHVIRAIVAVIVVLLMEEILLNLLI